MDLNSENITGMLWVSPSCPAPRFVTSFWREVVYQSKGTYSFFYIYTHLKTQMTYTALQLASSLPRHKGALPLPVSMAVTGLRDPASSSKVIPISSMMVSETRGLASSQTAQRRLWAEHSMCHAFDSREYSEGFLMRYNLHTVICVNL